MRLFPCQDSARESSLSYQESVQHISYEIGSDLFKYSNAINNCLLPFINYCSPQMVQTRSQQAANGDPLPVEPIQIGPDCVEVHVGIEPYIKRYKYIKQIVTSQSDYFRKALRTYVVGNGVAQFADAASKIAKLPDVDSNINKRVDWWLGKKKVREQPVDADISDIHDCKGNIDVVTYIEIYKLALFLGIKTLQNHIMRTFWDAWPPHPYTGKRMISSP